MKAKTICVMGLGYIGLPTASLLATKGHRVVGVDVNPDVVDTINRGEIHLVEPDLDILVRSAVNSGNLRASLTPEEADVFVLAVPTPYHHDDHRPDIGHVEAAARAIAPFVRPDSLVVLESTSPVGTTERVAELLAEANPSLRKNGRLTCFVAHCPERVLPGRILYELVENHRIVGGLDPRSTDAAVAFYEGLVNAEVHGTDCRTAEMCKLVENSYRDVNIAFANELSIICQKLGINVHKLIGLANRHPRVGILTPGPGVGGHCIAVDPWFIVASAPEESRIIRTARLVNDSKAEWVVQRVKERASRLRDPVIACLGLAYKQDVDDLRESPALWIARQLRDQFGDNVLAVEPNLARFDEMPLTDLDTALSRADIVVALVPHREFLRIDPEFLKDRILIDTCGVVR